MRRISKLPENQAEVEYKIRKSELKKQINSIKNMHKNKENYGVVIKTKNTNRESKISTKAKKILGEIQCFNQQTFGQSISINSKSSFSEDKNSASCHTLRKSPQQISCNIYERHKIWANCLYFLYKIAKNRNEKRKNLKKQNEKITEKECSFIPKIKKKIPNGIMVPTNNFTERSILWNKEKDQKISKIKVKILFEIMRKIGAKIKK